MLRDILKDGDQSLSDQALINALPAAINLTTGIAKTGYNLASKFTTGVIGGLLGSGTKIAKSVMGRAGSKSVRDEKIKSPHYSNVSAGRVVPVRKGDGNADIIAKMYNFMLKNYNEQKKNDEIKRNFEIEQREEDERRHKSLLQAIKKLSQGTDKPKPKENSFLKFFAGIIKSIFASISSIVGILSQIKSFIASNIERAIIGLKGTVYETVKTILQSIFKSKLIRSLLGGAGGGKLKKFLNLGLIGMAVGGPILGWEYYQNKKKKEEDFKTTFDMLSNQDQDKRQMQRVNPIGTYTQETEDALDKPKSDKSSMVEYAYISPVTGKSLVVPLTDDEYDSLWSRYYELNDPRKSSDEKQKSEKEIIDITSKGLSRYKNPDNEELMALKYPTYSSLSSAIESATGHVETAAKERLKDVLDAVDASRGAEKGSTYKKIEQFEKESEEFQQDQFNNAIDKIIDSGGNYVEQEPTPAPTNPSTPTNTPNTPAPRPQINLPTFGPGRNSQIPAPTNVQGMLDSGSPTTLTMNNVQKTGSPKKHDSGSTKVRDPRTSLAESNKNNIRSAMV